MIVLENITKTYHTHRGPVGALVDLDLHIPKGQFVVIRGPSGSGKTTLLLTLAGMQHPTSGKVLIAGKNIYNLSNRLRANSRAQNIGFVFQMFHLVPYLNVVDNVALAGPAAGNHHDITKAHNLLEKLGLAERIFHKPAQLSAGEKQRTAIARALYNNPKIILADEPTGNLDPENASAVLDHLAQFHRQGGTVIIVTHGLIADQYADRIIHLRQGRLTNPPT